MHHRPTTIEGVAKSSSLQPFGILSESLRFMRKQPVLAHVVVLLLVLPAVVQSILEFAWPSSAVPSLERIGQVGYAIAVLVCALTLYWGQAATLVISRRIVSSKAGRGRTSFAAVRKQSSTVVFPLIVTDILRTLVTLEWCLIPAAAFIVMAVYLPGCPEALNLVGPHSSASLLAPCAPALITTPLLLLPLLYLLRTMLAGVIVVTEGLKARDALRESSRVLKGSLFRVCGSLVVILIVLFAPLSLLSMLVGAGATDGLSGHSADGLFAGLSAAASSVFTVAMVVAYTRLQSRRPKLVMPEA